MGNRKIAENIPVEIEDVTRGFLLPQFSLQSKVKRKKKFITKCKECDFYLNESCAKMKMRMVLFPTNPSKEIPDWCPLPDYKED